MDIQLPGKSLDAQFASLWERFSKLPKTVDSLNTLDVRLRRWLTPISVACIVPIDDDQVCAYLEKAQHALAPYMRYAPQPTERLHITLFMVGYLRGGFPFPNTWTRDELNRMTSNAVQMFRKLPNFTVRVGPINTFPNVAIAEVRDDGHLRLLERAAASVIPETRRMTPRFSLLPHITLGYWGERPVPEIVEAIRPMRDWPSLPLQINRASVTLYYRELGTYKKRHVLERSVEQIIGTLPLSRRK